MNKKILCILQILTVLIIGTQYAISADLVQDEIVSELLKDKNYTRPCVNTGYNYKDTKYRTIRLTIIADINSEKDVYEGQTVYFESVDDVYLNRKRILKKGDFIPARVETIIKSGMNGIPASIIFGNFKINNIEPRQLEDTYEVFGQDRSLWVFPLKWALTPLPPTGSLTNFIKGGRAKLKTNEIIELKFYPHR